MPAFEALRRDAGLPQPGSDPFAQLEALTADDDDLLLVGIVRCPIRDRTVVAARRRGQKDRIGGEILVDPDIDDRRCVGPADEPGQLRNRDLFVGRHDASILKQGSWTRALGRSLTGSSR
ncbi:hypothetical protein [Bosea sp. TAB14]|uniref:hypothetical protein n=1 Tax=Bosea sp. TAB14 TaxID=3237481 RepID=UPI003F90C928